MSSRDLVLQRIRTALGPSEEGGEDTISRAYRRRDEASRESLVEQFAERVAEYRATVHRVEAGGLQTAIAEACDRRGLRSLAVPGDLPRGWLPPEVAISRDTPESRLSTEQLDRSDGVLTGCALGIAQTGTIVLDGGSRQGRRALTLVPDYHLCVVYEDQIVGLVPEAIARLSLELRESNRPITFISGPSATSDIELNRVEGVHGPRTLDVILVGGGHTTP